LGFAYAKRDFWTRLQDSQDLQDFFAKAKSGFTGLYAFDFAYAKRDFWTGLQDSQDLHDFFAKAKSGFTRLYAFDFAYAQFFLDRIAGFLGFTGFFR
jgi:hypothetical protein